LPLLDRTIRVTAKPLVETLIIRLCSAATESTMDLNSDVDSPLMPSFDQDRRRKGLTLFRGWSRVGAFGASAGMDDKP
jgi:hypothetical protein